MRFKKKSYLLLFCLLALSTRATTWYVAPDGDDGAAGTSWGTALLTIGTGVSKASAPDTMLVSNGVYMLPGEVWVSKGITIQSVNGRDVTTVNGNNPATGSRCFTLNHVDAVLDGFTITNGMTSLYGGGVYVPHGTVIVNSIIYHNRAGTASASNYTVYIAPACFTNCCLAPEVSGGSAACSANNITDDPMFVDTQTGNFRLLRDSPCINAGVNQDWMTDAADMNNWPRINEEAVDMGCYEYVEEGCVFRFF